MRPTPGAPPPLARQRRRHPRGAARERLRRRRPDPDARRLQIEWNKIRVRQRAAGWPPESEPTPEECAAALGGSADDWARLRAAWGERFFERSSVIAERRMALRVRMLGGTLGRLRADDARAGGAGPDAAQRGGPPTRPTYFVSSNTHSLVNIVTGAARARGAADRVRREPAGGRHPARGARRLPRGPHRGLVGQLPLLRRGSTSTRTARRAAASGASPGRSGVSHIPTALRVPAQIIPLAKLLPDRLDLRLGDVDPRCSPRATR